VIVAGEEALSLVECGLLHHEQKDGTLISRVADPGGELLIRNYVLQKLQKGKK